MSVTDLKAHCSTCEAKRACMHTFGAYWHAKSGGGKGCELPMSAEHAKAVERVLDAPLKPTDQDRPQETMKNTKALARIRRFINTGRPKQQEATLI